MAKEQGVSEATVRRIWHAHSLQPHRVETFKLSRDPAFVAKLRECSLRIESEGLPTPKNQRCKKEIKKANSKFVSDWCGRH